MAQALQGIRVLELAQYVNGPSAAAMLGDLGADIIKIEHRVRGDADRGAVKWFGSAMSLPGGRTVPFEGHNRNKKSVTLDLEKPEGQEVLYRLAKKSDVFLTNFFKSVTDKLCADYNTLSRHNPRIIYARTTGLGGRGPESEKRAYDWIGQARSGLMTIMGDRDGPPQIAVGALVDQMGSTLLAYGILAAIIARERLGIGQEIDTSMLGAAIHMQEFGVSYCLFKGHALSRHSRTKTRAPFSNFYQCADGKWLLLSEIQVYKFWPQLCQALGMPEIEKDPKFASMETRRENAKVLISMIEKTLLTRPAEEWAKILSDGVGIACSRVATTEELASDPQILANDYIIDFKHPVFGPVKLVGFPVHFSKTPASVRTPAPEFGQHTEEVLLDVGGYSWDEIAKLKEDEVI